VTNEGPLPPRRAAWIVSEVAAATATAHAQHVAHGRLIPENVLIDHTGGVKVIGCCVDAALHGLPPGRISSDVTDLGGLLYFALTGKWAGSSSSQMPPAPDEHGGWLRPRQVRAGIPRVLDAICEEVLNPFAATPSDSGHNHHTALGLASALQDYVGDPTGLAETAVHGVAGAGVLAVPERRTTERPAPADPEPTRAMPSDQPTLGLEPPPEAPAAPEPVTGEQPTEAGMPIFDDEGDTVSWFRARHQPPPPPPPLADPPDRPLFAPEPSDGGTTRRSRPHATTGQPDYWPWDSETGAGTGSGVIPVAEDPDDEDEVPGRSWFRLAALIGTALLLLIAVLLAFNLGRGKSPLGAEPQPETPSTSGPTADPVTAIEGTTARAFDPQGDTPEENSDQAPLAVDGDPATAWPTSDYFDQFGPTGLKTGVGLLIDLGKSQQVSRIDITTIGTPTEVTYYLSDTAPRAVADLEPIAEGTVSQERLRTRLDEPATGQYLVVWLTSLPAVGDVFRAEIAEVVVRG
jgi:serine/threonine protein kinase